jgi:hypothetical protein
MMRPPGRGGPPLIPRPIDGLGGLDEGGAFGGREEAADGEEAVAEQLGAVGRAHAPKVRGRAPAREGTEIQTPDGAKVGIVTSGGFGPSAEAPIAMGYVTPGLKAPGTELHLIVRGKALPARVAALPFVQREALLLHQEGEMSLDEIATLTGANRETVKSRLRYALSRLRAQFTGGAAVAAGTFGGGR